MEDYKKHHHVNDLLFLCARAGNLAAESRLGKAILHNDDFFLNMTLKQDAPLSNHNSDTNGALIRYKLVGAFLRHASDAEFDTNLMCWDIESVLGHDAVFASRLSYAIFEMSFYYSRRRLEQTILAKLVPLDTVDSDMPWLKPETEGTLDYGLQLFSSTTDSLIAYSDANWAGCPTTRRSTSSAEAEYRGVVNAVAETCWIRNLLRELHTPLSSATIVYCDNRTKHIEIDIHYVLDLVATGRDRVLHVPSRFQYADIFTKGLPSTLFDEFRDSLSIRCTPAPTAGEY
nr:ribonuclease H-like domain-containing protein [Tanacetum cinerariifolium]